MALLLVSDEIHVTISIDPDTRALFNRALDIADQSERIAKQEALIAKLAARLNVSSDSLASTATANPDPDATD